MKTTRESCGDDDAVSAVGREEFPTSCMNLQLCRIAGVLFARIWCPGRYNLANFVWLSGVIHCRETDGESPGSCRQESVPMQKQGSVRRLLCAHLGVVEYVPVLAFRLPHIEGKIGVLLQLPGVGAIRGINGDSDGHADLRYVITKFEGL